MTTPQDYIKLAGDLGMIPGFAERCEHYLVTRAEDWDHKAQKHLSSRLDVITINQNIPAIDTIHGRVLQVSLLDDPMSADRVLGRMGAWTDSTRIIMRDDKLNFIVLHSNGGRLNRLVHSLYDLNMAIKKVGFRAYGAEILAGKLEALASHFSYPEFLDCLRSGNIQDAVTTHRIWPKFGLDPKVKQAFESVPTWNWDEAQRAPYVEAFKKGMNPDGG